MQTAADRIRRLTKGRPLRVLKDKWAHGLYHGKTVQETQGQGKVSKGHRPLEPLDPDAVGTGPVEVTTLIILQKNGPVSQAP